MKPSSNKAYYTCMWEENYYILKPPQYYILKTITVIQKLLLYFLAKRVFSNMMFLFGKAVANEDDLQML